MQRFRPGHTIADKRRTSDVLTEEQIDFGSLLLSPSILRGLTDSGFEKPSPIQLKAIPLGRCGLDLIAQAKSGTGKTCVFSVITLENILIESNCIQVLILAPTREIAVQIKDVINAIGCHLGDLGCCVFIGGLPLDDDKKALKRCHIAVGTPGRIKYLIQNKLLKTDSVRMFILDEADKLLDDSFQEQINWIFSSLPANKQMMAFSATYSEYLANHLTRYMREPTFVRLNAADPTLQGMKQFYSIVPFHPLPHKTFQGKVEGLLKLLTTVNYNQCLVFSNYQIRAQSLSETLCAKGWPATFIAGSQTQAKRLKAMEKLKQFRCRILISTDLTARGIDAENVNLVVNMDVPRDRNTYLHRIGRGGRFGTRGVAVTFVAKGKEEKDFKEIESSIDVTIEPLPEHIPDSLMKSEPTNVGVQGSDESRGDAIEIRIIKNNTTETVCRSAEGNADMLEDPVNGDSCDSIGISIVSHNFDQAVEQGQTTPRNDSTVIKMLDHNDGSLVGLSKENGGGDLEGRCHEDAKSTKRRDNKISKISNTENQNCDLVSSTEEERGNTGKESDISKGNEDVETATSLDNRNVVAHVEECGISSGSGEFSTIVILKGKQETVLHDQVVNKIPEIALRRSKGEINRFSLPSGEEFEKDFEEYLAMTSCLGATGTQNTNIIFPNINSDDNGHVSLDGDSKRKDDRADYDADYDVDNVTYKKDETVHASRRQETSDEDNDDSYSDESSEENLDESDYSDDHHITLNNDSIVWRSHPNEGSKQNYHLETSVAENDLEEAFLRKIAEVQVNDSDGFSTTSEKTQSQGDDDGEVDADDDEVDADVDEEQENGGEEEHEENGVGNYDDNGSGDDGDDGGKEEDEMELGHQLRNHVPAKQTTMPSVLSKTYFQQGKSNPVMNQDLVYSSEKLSSGDTLRGQSRSSSQNGQNKNGLISGQSSVQLNQYGNDRDANYSCGHFHVCNGYNPTNAASTWQNRQDCMHYSRQNWYQNGTCSLDYWRDDGTTDWYPSGTAQNSSQNLPTGWSWNVNGHGPQGYHDTEHHCANDVPRPDVSSEHSQGSACKSVKEKRIAEWNRAWHDAYYKLSSCIREFAATNKMQGQ